MKIALLAAEVAPFAKTGGLADVVASLGRALHRRGHEVRIFLPLYGAIRTGDRAGEFALTPVPEPGDIRLEYPQGMVDVGVSTAPLPNSEREDGSPLLVEFLDCPQFYHREQYYTSDPDEPLRWATLARASLAVLARSEWKPDVIHCNDWHAGLVPLYFATAYRSVPSFASTETLLSIHNLGFQGIFGGGVIDQLGLSAHRDLFHQERLARDQVSFLETGLLHASWLSTVSETYAREIQDPEHGMGLDQLLRARSDRLVGIVNGIEMEEWSPDRDPLIPVRFSAADPSGKDGCREALLARFGIGDQPAGRPSARSVPVVGIVSRLTAQKGFDLLSAVGDVERGPVADDLLDTLLRRNRIKFVVLGSGEARYQAYFQALRDRFPDRVGVYFGFDEELAHWIEAGSDLFLMPSQYEPCGLNQLYSLSYGTVPVVRRTGGLADTVQPWDWSTGAGTGFVFDRYTPVELADAMDRALGAWADPAAWAVLMANGMAQDYSWQRQSGHYLDLYRRILES